MIEFKKYVQFSQNEGIPHILYDIFIHYCTVPYTVNMFIRNMVFVFIRQQRVGNDKKP
jgi:hypothetical protein